MVDLAMAGLRLVTRATVERSLCSCLRVDGSMRTGDRIIYLYPVSSGYRLCACLRTDGAVTSLDAALDNNGHALAAICTCHHQLHTMAAFKARHYPTSQCIGIFPLCHKSGRKAAVFVSPSPQRRKCEQY